VTARSGKASVFISYARSSARSEAEALQQVLGQDAFLDSADIEAGQPIPTGVVDALLGARMVVVFADTTYFTRWYCLREFDVALAPFNALLARGAPEAERADALAPVLVALAEREPPLERFPALVRSTNWPSAADTAALAALVQQRLVMVRPTLTERLEALGALGAIRATVLAAAAVPPPQHLGGVPVYALPGELRTSIGDAFVGRADELWRIHHELSTLRGGPAAAALTGALEGGGGVGKTRLATEYLHRFGPAHYPGGLFWVNAEVGDRLEEQLHGILATVVADVPDLIAFRQARRDAARELARALHELGRSRSVLYVVDNIPEPDLGGAAEPLSRWCPAVGEVSLLVTSRARQSLVPGVASLGVDVLAPAPAVALLTRDYLQQRLAEGAWETLAETVGRLPLALELLNAALRAGVLEPDELAARLTASTTTTLDDSAEALRRLVPAGSLRGISEALSLSYDRLLPEARLAARLLGQLAPSPIPTAVVQALGVDGTVRATLLSRSFLTPVTRDGAITLFGHMHRVLADFLRHQAPNPDAELHRAAVALTTVIHPDACRDPAAWPLLNACLPHAEEVYERLQDVAGEYTSEAVFLGTRIGLLLWAQGRVPRARAVNEEVVSLARDVFGPEHPDTLASANNLAATLRDLGEFERARVLHEEVLDVSRRSLGPEHSDTLNSLNNLAATLRDLGEFERARRLHEEALHASRRTLGAEHPDTLFFMDNLAGTLRALGYIEPAQALHKEALHASRRTLGAEHPDTLRRMTNLAGTLGALGELEGARALLDEAVETSRLTLGPEHPDTLGSMNSLAETLRTQGELQAAHHLHQEVLTARSRTLGPEHPDTVISMDNLAATLRDLGDVAGAQIILEEVVNTFRRTLGPEHPNTLTSTNNLGDTLRVSGEFERARVLLEGAVKSFRRTLGPEHPETTVSAWNLRLVLLELGERQAASGVVERDLSWLVSRHPDTLEADQRWIREKLVELGGGTTASNS
jgi:tetratricopeptide (TPR) repeat protein